MTEKLDEHIRKLALGSAVVLLLTVVLSLGLPLDISTGQNAGHAERIAWLLANRGMFVLGWINQILAMVSLTTLLACFAWQARHRNPLTALLGAVVLLASFVAFIIPKFIAVWTIPLLAQAASGPGVNQPMADALLLLLNVSAPFSLFTSFDYLGFWLYAVFALLVAPPLFYGGTLTRLSAVSFGLYGLGYHAATLAVLMGAIGADAIETYALGTTVFLVIPAVLAFGIFRHSGAGASSPLADPA